MRALQAAVNVAAFAVALWLVVGAVLLIDHRENDRRYAKACRKGKPTGVPLDLRHGRACLKPAAFLSEPRD